MKKVEVEWEDAQSSLHAETIEELEKRKPLMTKSIGYLAVKNKNYIILAFTDFGDGIVKHSQLIPVPMIKRMRELR